MSQQNEKLVCVTGASGFIASHLVKILLERGYTVHGTVRSTSNATKTQHLLNLPGAADRLKLFEADLLQEGSFDTAVAGCSVVFHTASPFFINGGTEENLVVPAVQGTTNVLDSVAKAGDATRVVLTSSTASVYVNYGAQPADYIYTEADWSNEDLARANGGWYFVSKTAAERAAWSFVEK